MAFISTSRGRWLFFALGICGGLGGLGALAAWYSIPPTDQLMKDARRLMVAGRIEAADRLAQRVLSRSPNRTGALLIAGEAASRQKRYDDALAYYDRVTDDGSPDARLALFVAGDLRLHRGRLCEAEACFRRILADDPRHTLANNRLAFVLGITGRRWESVPYLFELLQQDQFSFDQLLYLGNVEQDIELPVEFANMDRASSDELLSRISLARLALRENRIDQAETLLREVLAKAPGQIEAQARLGDVLLDRTNSDFLDWYVRLPDQSWSHPAIWSVCGTWAHKQGQREVAIRCYAEAIRLDPNHRVANYQIGQILVSMRRDDLAQPFLLRAERLRELETTLNLINEGRVNFDLMRKAAGLLKDLGRLWESWGWYRAALDFDRQSLAAREELARLRYELDTRHPPRVLADASPVEHFDFSAYPLPQWLPGGSPKSPAAELHTGSAQLSFVDVAQRVGIDFTFFNSADPETEGMRMFEFTGGGIAVLDFDSDGWPDLYLAQGCPWPPEEGQSKYTDRIYRNLGDGSFADCSSAAGLQDGGFSQGVTVGDVNDDGFPDLYVGNIGKNRFYQNNGDGTFLDITDQTGTGGDEWTTSCLVADLNGDSWPDLYVVNYLAGSSVYTELCRVKGVSQVCRPTAFDAAFDRLYLNLGDGRFEEQTDASGILAPNGKGLGIVAADFQNSGRLDLFVANDGTPNFLFLNDSSRGAPLRFVENGMASGAALDEAGTTKASMGVAAGDANGDGLIDLFVTAFYHESSTLFVQQPGGQFLDDSRRAGIHDPSFPMLGFGTQFIDVDLDGLPDLVVTNGHVDDFTHLGQPFQMPPQVFRNLGDGRFKEVPSAALGPFFEKKYVGRSLARLDWNRDGREDFAVSHLYTPFTLVSNQTRTAHHFLAIRLCGVASNRDAIGAVVTVTLGERRLTLQLTAGDGYEASNQRQLVIGLGTEDVVTELSVRWPSGLQQSFGSVPADTEFVLIEGRPEAIGLPRQTERAQVPPGKLKR